MAGTAGKDGIFVGFELAVAIPASSALATVLGRGIIFHFNLENSLVTSPPSSKCNLLMFVFTS